MKHLSAVTSDVLFFEETDGSRLPLETKAILLAFGVFLFQFLGEVLLVVGRRNLRLHAEGFFDFLDGPLPATIVAFPSRGFVNCLSFFIIIWSVRLKLPQLSARCGWSKHPLPKLLWEVKGIFLWQFLGRTERFHVGKRRKRYETVRSLLFPSWSANPQNVSSDCSSVHGAFVFWRGGCIYKRRILVSPSYHTVFRFAVTAISHSICIPLLFPVSAIKRG